jgi:hypothetical protein
MADSPTRGGPPPPAGPGGDEPVIELRDLEQDVSHGFIEAVRGKIERKVLAAGVAIAWWRLPMMVALEFLKALAQCFDSSPESEGGPRDGTTD